MSASLVGSEMCIRDRFCSARRFNVSEQLCDRRTPWPTLASRPWAQAWEAVSYTHLTLPTICSV
eukprot:10595065-Alexandrium_andersonii.AAC.1